MGRHRHDAIVVTCPIRDHAVIARAMAVTIGLEVTSLGVSRVNGFGSFLIIPDGGKKGWEDAVRAEVKRGEWMRWAVAVAQPPGGLGVEWVLVTFGGDDKGTAEVGATG